MTFLLVICFIKNILTHIYLKNDLINFGLNIGNGKMVLSKYVPYLSKWALCFKIFIRI